jgi:hypothetical protein
LIGQSAQQSGMRTRPSIAGTWMNTRPASVFLLDAGQWWRIWREVKRKLAAWLRENTHPVGQRRCAWLFVHQRDQSGTNDSLTHYQYSSPTTPLALIFASVS